VNGSSVCTRDQNLHLRSIVEYVFGYLFDVGCWNVSDLVRFYVSGFLSNRIKGDDKKFEFPDAVESFSHCLCFDDRKYTIRLHTLSISVGFKKEEITTHRPASKLYSQKHLSIKIRNNNFIVHALLRTPNVKQYSQQGTHSWIAN